MWIGGHPDDLPTVVRNAFIRSEIAPSRSVSDQAAELIREKYFRRTDPAELENGGVRGMIRALRRRYDDRFSHYFDPQQNRKLTESLDSRFTGVGMAVDSDAANGLKVVRVFRKSPAREAGIRPGDLIVTVDGKSVIGENVSLVVARVKGPEGTEVTLGVRRQGRGRTVEKTLVRREIQVPITVTRMRHRNGMKLGYVYFATFSRNSDRELKRAFERLERKGADGIVLDLRANGGGLLEQAVATASLFLKKGETVVETRSRTQGNTVYRALGDGLDPLPMVVLVDRTTASAAEILAAALQSANRVPVVGTRTFGKGLFQQVIALGNGGALDLSVGAFFTASGVSLAGKGLQPDVRVKQPPQATRDVQLDRAFAVLGRRVSGAGVAGNDG